MKITNESRLPAPLVAAVSRHPRERVQGRISVTEIIQPPQIRALTVKYDSELSEDASDRIWALMGTLLHGVLERNAKGMKDTIAEEALEMDVLGWTVVGHYDLSEMVLDGEILTDWKLTSVWSVKDGLKPEWVAQTNCYAELIRQAGRHISEIQIVTIGRDWSKSKAKYDQSYPQQQVKVFMVPLWSQEQAQAYIAERVQLHQMAETGVWPDCTPEERWARPTKYAVMKKGQKKAVKLYDDLDSVTTHAFGIDGLSVVTRPGESVRCESYCAVSGHCPQFAKIKAVTE